MAKARDHARSQSRSHTITLTHLACRPHGPILHDTYTLIFPVRARAARLDDLVEGLEAKAPVAAWRAVPPRVEREVREEVVLGPLQAAVLGHLVEERRVWSGPSPGRQSRGGTPGPCPSDSVFPRVKVQ